MNIWAIFTMWSRAMRLEVSLPGALVCLNLLTSFIYT
jgi:hypothetical protein